MVLDLRKTTGLIRHQKNRVGKFHTAKAGIDPALPTTTSGGTQRACKEGEIATPHLIRNGVMISNGPLQPQAMQANPRDGGGASRIVGEDEMIELVRGHDWAKTPLGPMEVWPHEIVDAVNLMLNSPAPARTLWGRELILIYNDPYRRFLGKRHPGALGMPAREVFRESWGVLGPIAEEAFATGRGICREKLCVPVETAEGLKDHYVDYASIPVLVGGKVAGLFETLPDVTADESAMRALLDERRRTESALLQSEKLAAVGRLASSIAHEINNPLESVMNLIYLARNSNREEAKRYLELADEETRRVSIIANQTLRFHKQASSPQATTAADLFSTVMSIYEGRLKNAHVGVEKSFRSRDPVACLQGDVRQVLNNLVGNALEAMPFGGRLLIRSRTGRNWKTGERGLILTIADNGGGIPREVQKRIFDAFFTTKGTAGNGLGLWVSQEIVERHHGALRVRSTQREGRNGTTFTLWLPFDPPAEAHAA
jgi:signal transduction histidine kinase